MVQAGMSNVALKDTSVVDPVRQIKQSAVLMQNRAESLMSDGFYESALTLLCAVLMIEPSRVSAIHKIGECLEASGAQDDAILCYRGALPDSITRKYLDSAHIADRIRPIADCMDVAYVHGFDEERISLNPPKRNKVAKNYGQFSYKETFARTAFCTVADEGSVWFDGVNTLALDKNSNIIKEQAKGNVFSSYHAIKTAKPRVLKGTACFLDGRSSGIYYHWMLDILPKIGVMKAAGIELEEIDHFIVMAKSKFQLETLRACGIREEQLVLAKDSTLYRASKMITPNLKNDQGEKVYHGLGVGLSSNVPRFLQEVFGSGQIILDKDKSRKIRVYISRSTRGSRNIANEPELVKVLEQRGFETVEFERLSVSGQAELMSRAEIVVGVHGAGFTNLSFCKPGTRVVEIFGDYVVPCYWALSAVAQLDYSQYMARSVVAAEAANNPGERVTQLRDMEIQINTEDFIEYLDETLESTRAVA